MATYYWVGGSGTWNNASNTNWAASSGGAGGAGIPNSADNVIFDTNSGTAATVDVTATAACLACTVNKSDITLSLSGSPTFSGAFTFTAGTVSLNSYNLTSLTFLASNANVRTLAFGTGRITVTGNNTIVFTAGNRTNLTLTGDANVYSTYSGATGTRTINLDSGGGTYATRINLFVTAGTDTVTTTGNSNGTLDFTGFAGTWALGSFASNYRGGLILNSSMTVDSGTNTLQTFNATGGPHNIDLAGKTIDCGVTFNGVGGSWVLQGTFTIGSTRALTLTNGTLNGNGQNVSIGTFATAAGGAKVLTLGSGTWTVQGATWNSNTDAVDVTVSASTGTISMTSGSAKTFSGGAKTWPTLNQGGAGTLTIAQSNTFTDITNTTKGATLALTINTTQTVSAFSFSGTSASQTSLNSSSAGTLATLNGTGGIVNARYLNIKDVRAQGYTEWNALVDQGAIDQGNTPGWNFITLGIKKILRKVFSRQIIRPVIEEIQ
jgi:autotransporter-associated beta strand protein